MDSIGMASTGQGSEYGANSSPRDAYGSNDASFSQTSRHRGFRRYRAPRACEMCRARKIRCDAATIKVPCTNCRAFGRACIIPALKQKGSTSTQKGSTPKQKVSTSKSKERTSKEKGMQSGGQKISDTYEPPALSIGRRETVDELPTTQPTLNTTSDNINTARSPITCAEYQSHRQQVNDSEHGQFMEFGFTRAPIEMAGWLAYLGESSGLNVLPDNLYSSQARLTELDIVEVDMLHRRGAFLLPPRTVCDKIVASYFTWVAPVVPVINRARFMKRYQSSENPPSLLLLQAILLAGSRVCTDPELMDLNGSTIPVAITFYKRAKALYDANYETDKVAILQALILMGSYCEDPEDVTRDAFYWTRVATVIAQSLGMHRSVEGSELSVTDKRLWKRIWWTLFTRDRSVAVALSRPMLININDCAIETICEEDFIEDGLNSITSMLHVQFFIQYVKLCDIMGLVLLRHYSIASKSRPASSADTTDCNVALIDWLQNCPMEVYWELPRHHFWSALLHSNYYTTLYLLHRAHVPRATRGGRWENLELSWSVAFRAAAMITSIIDTLTTHNELRYCPAFVVYSLFSALTMHVYQLQSSVPSAVQEARMRIQICRSAVKDISHVWLVANMLDTIFEPLLGNQMLQERPKKTPGTRLKKLTCTSKGASLNSQKDPRERKYDEMSVKRNVDTVRLPQKSYRMSHHQVPSQECLRAYGPRIGGIPVQAEAIQPGGAGYQAQQSMWQRGLDGFMDAQGHLPLDTWSCPSPQAVPSAVNMEDWFQNLGFDYTLDSMGLA